MKVTATWRALGTYIRTLLIVKLDKVWLAVPRVKFHLVDVWASQAHCRTRPLLPSSKQATFTRHQQQLVPSQEKRQDRMS
jgi:hypothetical protein